MAKGWACHAYRNANPFIGWSIHDSLMTVPVPPFQVPAKLTHVDFSVVQGLFLGSFPSTGRKKVIRADDLWLMGRMSDAGLGVPHISIPPSLFNLLTSLFASSNCVFGSSGVTIATKNIIWGNDDLDTAATPFGTSYLSINLGCFDPFCLPTDVVVVWGTLQVGVTWADIIAALIDIAISIVTDLVSMGLGSMIGGLAKKIGKSATSKSVKFVTGTASSEAYEAYAKRAAATQGMRNALEMSDDDIARFVSRSGGDEGTEAMLKNSGVEAFAEEYGDQWKKADILESWEAGFKEALEEIDAKKAAGVLADDGAEKALQSAALREALEELEAAIKAVDLEELLFAMLVKMLKSTLTTTASQLLFYGNALGSGSDGGVFSFEGAGWFDTGTRRQFSDRYGDDSLLDLYELVDDMSEQETQATTSTSDDEYWFNTGMAELMVAAQESAEPTEGAEVDDGGDEDDDYWWDTTAAGGSR